MVGIILQVMVNLRMVSSSQVAMIFGVTSQCKALYFDAVVKDLKTFERRWKMRSLLLKIKKKYCS